ncbi:Uncharacterised protein [Zhongshania aliphaticivorans]|uniref:Lipoprotein n=1 Tax=Zhongshania aliphaticivorans TaxID=1470434 RepID=A0A5S9NQX7_9GAMM|nr:hypothetical protein [Zhongshania aliphaticivorans]CAA0092942.1 Uncharacterised protein [Zhongshania aliphaticivorans]CAA0110609.1 Uncharacterised protein [Zhongshania aliphaticivorans]
MRILLLLVLTSGLLSACTTYMPKVSEFTEVSIDSASRVLVLESEQFNRTLLHTVFDITEGDSRSLTWAQKEHYKKIGKFNSYGSSSRSEFMETKLPGYVKSSMSSALSDAGVAVVDDSILSPSGSSRYLPKEAMAEVDFILVPHDFRIGMKVNVFLVAPTGIFLMVPSLGFFPFDCPAYPTSLAFSVFATDDLENPIDTQSFELHARRCGSLLWWAFPKGMDVNGVKKAIDSMVNQEAQHLQNIYLF